MSSRISIVSFPVKYQIAAKIFFTSVLACWVVEDNHMMAGSHRVRLEISGMVSAMYQPAIDQTAESQLNR